MVYSSCFHVIIWDWHWWVSPLCQGYIRFFQMDDDKDDDGDDDGRKIKRSKKMRKEEESLWKPNNSGNKALSEELGLAGCSTTNHWAASETWRNWVHMPNRWRKSSSSQPVVLVHPRWASFQTLASGRISLLPSSFKEAPFQELCVIDLQRVSGQL